MNCFFCFPWTTSWYCQTKMKGRTKSSHSMILLQQETCWKRKKKLRARKKAKKKMPTQKKSTRARTGKEKKMLTKKKLRKSNPCSVWSRPEAQRENIVWGPNFFHITPIDLKQKEVLRAARKLRRQTILKTRHKKTLKTLHPKQKNVPRKCLGASNVLRTKRQNLLQTKSVER